MYFFSALVVWNGFSSMKHSKQTVDVGMFPLPAMLKTFTDQENIERPTINIPACN